MNARFFIGSSSESLPTARALQVELEANEKIDVTLWTQNIFTPSAGILDSLLRASKNYDYAVFIFGADDVANIRRRKYSITRDNVIFELGLFISSLGRERCFFMVPTDIGQFRVPTDLSGINYLTYRKSSHDGNLRASVGAACTSIIDTINKSDLAGPWLLFREGLEAGPHGEMFITCEGEKATGYLRLLEPEKDVANQRAFRYEGKYRAGQFAFVFEQRQGGDQIIGSMVLHSNAGRTLMNGQSAFWHHDRAEMVNTRFELRRE